MVKRLFLAALLVTGGSAAGSAANPYGIVLNPGEVLVSVDGVPCHRQTSPVAVVVRRPVVRAITAPVIWVAQPIRRVLRCAGGNCR